MIFTCDAIYEDGVLRPLEPLPPGLLKEGQRMRGTLDHENMTITLYPYFEAAEASDEEVDRSGNRS